MRQLALILALALLPLLNGCARNHFNIPQERVAGSIKVLGVAPIFIDGDSDIRHPQRDELITLVSDQNRRNQGHLLRLLKDSTSFYKVTMLEADPKALFSELLARRERRDDAAIHYNKYFWKAEPLQELIRKNSLDALMVVVVSGITRPEKISSANLLETLQADYNYLIITAQIIDSRGAILWEYPNFRTRILSYRPLINLQYPNFDEARANTSSKVEIKFKTMEGIKRALDKRRQDFLRRETSEVELYFDQFEAISSLLKIDREQKPAADVSKPAPATGQQP